MQHAQVVSKSLMYGNPVPPSSTARGVTAPIALDVTLERREAPPLPTVNITQFAQLPETVRKKEPKADQTRWHHTKISTHSSLLSPVHLINMVIVYCYHLYVNLHVIHHDCCHL